MNFPFYIARRYLISKKSHNAINWISGISVVGVAITTMALVVTLSVFNGFHDMVATFFTTLDPDLKITPTNGKFMRADDTLLQDIRKIDGVEGVYESIEDQALLIYGQNQKVVRLRGVDDKFQQLTKIDSITYGEGDFKLWDTQLDIEKSVSELVYEQVPCATLGIGVADDLGTGVNFTLPLNVFVPERDGQIDITNPEAGFSQAILYPSGVLFNVKQQKYDKNYIIVPISFARDLFGQKGMISALNIKANNVNEVKSKIESILGNKYRVSDLYEQQEDVFRIMKVEKLMAYIFLTFILIIACFNIISSLSMLIIDKKDDVITLRSLGANDRQISNIFLFEGRLISTLGAVIGIFIGILLCWLQETYGFVALGKSSGNFVVDAYPVSVHGWDIVLIFVTVVAVGFLSVCYPVHSLLKAKKT